MFISRLVIQNYRNFRQVDIPLHRQNIIMGANRVGKSNLISAIRLAIDPNLPPTARKLSSSDFWDGSGEPYDGRRIIVVIELDLETEEERNAMMDVSALIPTSQSAYKNTSEAISVKPAVNAGEDSKKSVLLGKTPEERTSKREFGSARFTYEFYPRNDDIDEHAATRSAENELEGNTESAVSLEDVDSEDGVGGRITVYHPSQYSYIWYTSIWHDVELKEKLKKEVNIQRLGNRLIMLTLRALRDTEDLLSQWSRSPLKSLLEGLDLDRGFLEGITKQIRDEAGKVAIDNKVDQLMRDIGERSSQMIGEIFNIGPTLNAISNDADDLLKAMQLFVDRDKPKPRPVSHASLGALNILYLALLLEDMYRNKLNSGQQTIMALEEPEAHVHPHVQRSLFRYFVASSTDERSCSLVVTTHSPHIVSVSPITSLIILRDKPGGEGTKPSWMNQGDFIDAEILDIQRYLDVTRGELIFAKSIIFVEGVTEQFLLPVFAKSLGVDFDHLGISVVSVEGTDFEPYIKLASPRSFNIPFVVLTDRDQRISDESDDYDGKGALIEPGLTRARRLIKWLDPTVTGDLDREHLAQRGIFLGESSTFEVELIKTCHTQMCQAYAGLVARQSTKDEFQLQMNATRTELFHGTEDKGVKEVLRRIEDKGKGRYAQRLSAILGEMNEPSLCPTYLQKSIRYAEALSLEAAGLASMIRWKN